MDTFYVVRAKETSAVYGVYPFLSMAVEAAMRLDADSKRRNTPRTFYVCKWDITESDEQIIKKEE